MNVIAYYKMDIKGSRDRTLDRIELEANSIINSYASRFLGVALELTLAISIDDADCSSNSNGENNQQQQLEILDGNNRIEDGRRENIAAIQQ